MAQPRYVDRAKSIIVATLNTTARVSRKSSVPDNSGGTTDSYAVVGTYQCSFERYQITPVERENTVTLVAQSFWRFTFPYGTTILPSDRLTCNGRAFEVVASATGSLEVATRVLCQEIT